MPLYHKLGKMPQKRHTTFKKKDGTLHYEQLFGTTANKNKYIGLCKTKGSRKTYEDKKAAILKNHGLLTVGSTVEEAA